MLPALSVAVASYLYVIFGVHRQNTFVGQGRSQKTIMLPSVDEKTRYSEVQVI
jgi:hypothetical protein